MSTQSITQSDLNDMKEKIDELLVCVSDKMILSSKLGFTFKYKSKDIFLINYLYQLVHNPNNCRLISGDKCYLDKINNLLLKYK